MELHAYFIMAYEHFYLANVDKFKFYMYRYERGVCEDDNSVLKKMFETAERSRERALNRMSHFDTSSRIKEKSMINLPSPSQMMGSGGQQNKFKFDAMNSNP